MTTTTQTSTISSQYPQLIIGGIESFSTVDWPHHMVATAFLRGCPWRCPYCHNAHLWQSLVPLKDGEVSYTFHDLEELLLTRSGLLDGVVFSGGEPTLQKDLLKAVLRVKELGFQVGLHTGGAYPKRFIELLPHLDWVGFDLKAPFSVYEKVTKVKHSGEDAHTSFFELIKSDIPFEIRTTYHPELLSHHDLEEMAAILQDVHITSWVVQSYRSLGAPGTLSDIPVYQSDIPEHIRNQFSPFIFR